MFIHEKLYSKVKGNVLFVYDPVTKHTNVNRQINVTNADLGITFLFVLALNKEDGLLLQTATTVVFNRENSNKKKNARILFDKGSQKSFINQSLRDELNLKTQKN